MMNRIEIKSRGLTFDGWADGPEKEPEKITQLLLEHLAEHA